MEIKRMARTTMRITEYKQHIDVAETRILNDRDEYAAFLRSVGWHYKRAYEDILAIHTFRPEAAAVASYDFWNEYMRRRIIAGSKGIPILRGSRSEYVYDIRDTKASGDYISPTGNIQRLDNALERMPAELTRLRETLTDARKQLEGTERELSMPFARSEELEEKQTRLRQLETELKLNEHGSEDIIDDGEGETPINDKEQPAQEKPQDMCR
jgi:hypothetical protein